MPDRPVESAAQTLPMPPWMTNHDEIEVIYHADTGGNDAYEAACNRHYTRSGPCFWTGDEARAWKCPDCQCEAHEQEVATRDD